MTSQDTEPGLYGISKSNRPVEEFWGKNQFNSTFPVALACYMRDQAKNAVYLRLEKDLKVKATEISFDDVFNTSAPNEDLYFAFESKFPPYEKYAYDDIGSMDVVVMKGPDYLRPLEIKLTVLPDQSTHSSPEKEWCSELVIRPAATKYCALGIVDSCKTDLEKVREIVEPVCSGIKHWDSEYEIRAKASDILEALDTFQKAFLKKQKPLLMQTIWKTQGKSPHLAEQAFDVFIWSDFALCRLFLDASQEAKRKKISRCMRSSARFARFLYEVSTIRKANLTNIWTEMAFGHQTDKEFAPNGKTTRPYMECSRLVTPSFSKEVLRSIILNGGEKELKPERRLDATVYYSDIFAKPEKK